MLYCTPGKTMSTDESVLKILEDVRADIKGLKQGQQALQDDMTVVKADTAKIPGLELRFCKISCST
jgi:hypothetical protein